MKGQNRSVIKTIVALLMLSVSLISCAKFIPLALKNRILIIHPDKPVLAYPHCSKHSWLTGKCKDRRVDEWGLNVVFLSEAARLGLAQILI